MPIVSFNPLHERGLEAFTNPQKPPADAHRHADAYQHTGPPGEIGRRHGRHHGHVQSAHRDGTNHRDGAASVLDWDFINQHTHGFEKFADAVRAADWAALERRSGLTRNAMEAAALVYARAERVIGMLRHGPDATRQGRAAPCRCWSICFCCAAISGKPGAGICPVRGHSNVQGQRTVGITEKPKLAPLDRLAEQYGFEPPRDEGLNTVTACDAMLSDRINAFIGLGGNFIRAVPEREAMEAAWRRLPLTVQMSPN